MARDRSTGARHRQQRRASLSQHAGLVIVCDGTETAARRLARVLWNHPATGVMRHADAGYEDAIACAKEHGLRLPGTLG